MVMQVHKSARGDDAARLASGTGSLLLRTAICYTGLSDRLSRPRSLYHRPITTTCHLKALEAGKSTAGGRSTS